MNFKNFLKSLLPSFSKDRMREDLSITRDEINIHTLPMMMGCAETFGTRKFTSDYALRFDAMFKENAKINYRGNCIAGMSETIQNMSNNIDFIEKLVNKYYANDIMRDALTVAKINIMQYLETMMFTARYTRRITVLIMALEVNIAKNLPEFDDVLQGDINWLDQNKMAFFTAINIMSFKRQEVEKKMAAIPDVAATEESIDVVTSTQGAAVIDPFKFGLIPIVLNPIYHIRISVAEYQASRYRSAEAERKMVEFRVQQLQQLQNGDPDAGLEKQIEYNQDRLQKLNRRIYDMESDNG